jgi:hypothetical protein
MSLVVGQQVQIVGVTRELNGKFGKVVQTPTPSEPKVRVDVAEVGSRYFWPWELEVH